MPRPAAQRIVGSSGRAAVRRAAGRYLPLGVFAAVLWGAGDATALDPRRSIDQYAVDSWGTEEGLPEGSVLALLPTSDGFLWLGTQFGLVRFDGVDFRVFAEDTPGLRQHSFGRALLEDRRGVLWAGLVGGVARYGEARFTFFDDRQGLSHPFVYALAPASDDSLWVGTGGAGVWRLQDERFSLHPAYRQPGLPTKVNDLATDGQGTLWVATDGGVLALGTSVERFTRADGLGSQVANALLVDRRGTLWVGTREGLSRRENRRFRTLTTRDGLPHDDVTALLEDRDGSLWVGTHEGGICRFVDGRFERPLRGRATSRGGVLALAEDASGSLWAGTDHGLLRLRAGEFVTLGLEEGLRNERLLNVTPRRAGGLWVLDGSGALLVVEQGRARQLFPPGTITGEGMLDLEEAPDGTLWIGGPSLQRLRGGRFERYARAGGEFTVVLPEGPGLIVAQTLGDGTSTLSRFEEGAFAPVDAGTPLVHVQRLYRDRRSRLWISTGGGGLVRVGPQGTRVYRVADGLPHDVVYGVQEDEQGRLWVATRGGLALIRGESVLGLSGPGAIARRSPLHLQLDDAGHLWVTDDEGVWRVPTAELEAWGDGRATTVDADRYGTTDGLRSVEVSWRPAGIARTDDGRIWCATSRGLSVVDPRSLGTTLPPPPASIEEMLVGGRRVDVGREVVADRGRERIEIRFTAPSLAAPGKLRFRFRLDGYDPDWVESRTDRSAHYTNVPAGTYTFRVAARYWHQDPDGAEAVQRLQVAARWYETVLARALAALTLGAILVGAHRLRLHRLRLRERALVAKVAERTLELSQEVAERRRAEEEVRRLNEELEGRVRERTAQLEAANLALAEDVAERQRAEAALADEKERLAVTLRSLAEGVIATDTAGRIVLMNPVAERLTGWSLAHAAGRALSQAFAVVDRSSREPLENPLARVLASTGSSFDMLSRAVLVGRDGLETLVDVSAAPIRDRESRIVGAVLVFRDVTEKTLAEEQLHKAQKLEAVGVLAAGIAHDFNNLLTGIFGHVDLARAHLPPGSAAAARLEGALDVVDNARSLARQLLTFSVGGRPATETHDLGEILRRSARFVLSGSNVSADLAIPDDLKPCDVDPQQIRQAIDNLLLNARQAMPAGGRITITAANARLRNGQVPPLPGGDYVCVRIADEGGGIPPQVGPRVFDPFFTTKASGSGLGLATVHSIVTQHGGAVDFDSVLGRGTTFRLHLRAVAGGEVREDRPAPAEPRGGTGRILVLDDEPSVREIAEAALQELGYEVETAAEGRQAETLFARAQAEGKPFDLVILDLTIAGGRGGVDTLAALRILDPGIPAIATSGYSSGDVLADPQAHGFSGKLPKPYTIADLATAVSSLLRRPPRGPGG